MLVTSGRLLKIFQSVNFEALSASRKDFANMGRITFIQHDLIFIIRTVTGPSDLCPCKQL